MIIKQLSVFLENKKGCLYDVTQSLADKGINIRALSLADTAEFGILRLIVDRPDDGKKALSECGVIVNVTDVIAITMEDKPGGTLNILKLLAANDISVEYMYASVGQTNGNALMIMQVSDRTLAQKVLEENGLGNLIYDEIS